MRALLFLFLIGFSPFCKAIGTSSYYHFTVDNGLPSNNVYSVIEDRAGFKWIATDNGVAKYNGYSFRVFTTKEGLPTNDIWKLHEDEEGRIWLFSNSFELGYIQEDTYYPLKLNNPSSNIFPVGIASLGHNTAILYTERGMYYIAVLFNGVATTVPIKINPLNADYKSRCILLSEDKHLWLFYHGNWISSVNVLFPQNEVIKRKTNEDTYSTIATSNSAMCDEHFYYAYGYKSRYINSYDIKQNLFRKIDVSQNGMGDLWVSYFQNNQLYAITEKGYHQIKNAKIISTTRFSVPTNSQISYVGSFQNTWFCTNSDGIWVELASSDLGTSLKSVEYLNDANLVGQKSDTSYWWKRANKTLITTHGKKILAVRNMPSQGTLRHIMHAPNKRVYLYNTGTFEYDENRNTLNSLFRHKHLILKNHYVFSSDYKPERLTDSMALTYYNNISQMHALNDTMYVVYFHSTIELLTEKPDCFETTILEKERATGFANLKSLRLFCAYNAKNVYLFSYDANRRVKIPTNLLSVVGINNVRKIVEDGNGSIYILTVDDLFKYSPGGSLQRIKTNLNLNSADLAITQQYLVLSGDFGIAYSKVVNSVPLRFVRLLNFQKKFYNHFISASVDAGEILYLITNKGTYSVDLKNVNAGEFADDEIKTLFKVGFRRSPLKPVDTVVLESANNRLTFSHINHLGSGSTQMQYKMDDDEWHDAPLGEIPIHRLEPNKFYQFHYFLQDDFWKSDVHTLYVFILPKWYQKTEWQMLFIALGILFFGGSILSATAITKKMVAKSNEKRRVQTELELRAIHSQINPHFIFNTLSTALFFISKQQTKDAYEHVNNFSKLLRNYLKSSRERFITLSDEIEILRQYIELQQARFSKGFHYEIRVSDDINTAQLLLPSLLLQPLIENAINHGLFNKKGRGLLLIEFTKGLSDAELICTIDDNGIGRSKAELLNRRYKKEKNSYGTELTKDLIDIFKRYEQMDIDLQYFDKTEPETGTTVRLVIKNVKIASLR